MEEVIENITKEINNKGNKQNEDIKKYMLEFLNYVPEILREKYSLEKELKQLKEENKALKKEGRQALVDIEVYELNNVPKQDEGYRAKIKQANELAKKVLGLNCTISDKSKLLEKINTSLTALDSEEYIDVERQYQEILDKIYEKDESELTNISLTATDFEEYVAVEEQYQEALEEIYKKESKKQQEQTNKKIEKTRKQGIKQKAKKVLGSVSKFFSNAKMRFKQITQKNIAQVINLEIEEEPRQSDMQAQVDETKLTIQQKQTPKIQNTKFENIKVSNENGHIEREAKREANKRKRTSEEYIQAFKEAANKML